jgi:putative colanic acid biosynthesis UDP-glucose lipid carrier transferase
MSSVNIPQPRDIWLVQRQKSIIRPAQIAVDMIILTGLLGVLAYLKGGGDLDPMYRVLAILSVLLTLIFYNYFGVYHFHANALRATARLIKAWGMVVFSLLLIAFVSRTTEFYSRQVILLWMVGSYCLQLLAHLGIPLLLEKANLRQYRAKDPALMIGAGRLSRYLAQRINANPWIHVRVVGVVDDDEEAIRRWDLVEVPVLGGTQRLREVLEKHGIVSAYIALPLSASAETERIYAELVERHINIYWVPDVFRLNPLNLSLRELGGVPLIALSETPLLGMHKWLKTAEDKILAALALVVFGPVMLVLAILIKLDSPGPILFRQHRHGWNGEVIEVWKFRTMYVPYCQEDRVRQATRNDPRITRLGRFLRRTSLDELPQLFNVLQGKMSLVGPRPHAVEHNEYYSSRINWYMTRHRIKPGMTGLAQVEGFRGETETLEKMARRVELDLKYINNWSIGLDVWILIRTFFIFFGKNAYKNAY